MPTVTPRGYFLGKKDPVESPFREFKAYFEEALPAPPPDAHWGHLVTAAGEPWQMDGNGPDPEVTIAPKTWPGCGDCVECGKVHFLKLGNYDDHHHTVPLPSPNGVVEQYCAYQKCTTAELFSDPTQYDDGEAITTSLLGWCEDEEYGCKLPFTAPVTPHSVTDVKNAIYLGGGLLIGIQLPQNAETEFPNEWTWTPQSPILGGHCVLLTGYAEEYVALVSWGQLIKCTWEFLTNTIDEAHALVLPQMVAAGKTPSGLSIAKWESDLRELA